MQPIQKPSTSNVYNVLVHPSQIQNSNHSLERWITSNHTSMKRLSNWDYSWSWTHCSWMPFVLCHESLVGFSGAQLPEDNYLTWLCYWVGNGRNHNSPECEVYFLTTCWYEQSWIIVCTLWTMIPFLIEKKKSIWIRHFSMYDLIFQNSAWAQSLSQVTRQMTLYSGPQNNPQVQMTQDGHCGTQTQWFNLTRK